MDKQDILHEFEFNHRFGSLEIAFDSNFRILACLLCHRLAFYKLFTCIFLDCVNKDIFDSSTIEFRSRVMEQGQKGSY